MTGDYIIIFIFIRGQYQVFFSPFCLHITNTFNLKKSTNRTRLIKQVLFSLNRFFFEINRFKRYFSKMLTPPHKNLKTRSRFGQSGPELSPDKGIFWHSCTPLRMPRYGVPGVLYRIRFSDVDFLRVEAMANGWECRVKIFKNVTGENFETISEPSSYHSRSRVNDQHLHSNRQESGSKRDREG